MTDIVHPIDLTSREDRELSKPASTGSNPAVRVGKKNDLPLIIALHKPESKALGFIPRMAIEKYIEWRYTIVGSINDDDLSYLIFRPSSRDYPGITLIHQACVRHDARHVHVAKRMVERIAHQSRMQGDAALQLWCRGNLAANLFWDAVGFEPVAMKAGGKRRNIPLIGWRFPLVTHAKLQKSVVARRRSEAGSTLELTDPVQKAEILDACNSGSTDKLSNLLRLLSRTSS